MESQKCPLFIPHTSSFIQPLFTRSVKNRSNDYILTSTSGDYIVRNLFTRLPLRRIYTVSFKIRYAEVEKSTFHSYIAFCSTKLSLNHCLSSRDRKMSFTLSCTVRSLSAVLLFLLISSIPVMSDPVDLTSLDGWNIVVSPDATESERYAADELQRFLEQATGTELPIVREADRPDQHFFVGPGTAFRNSPVGFSTESYGSETLRIVVQNPHVAIAGGRPRGTLYGVYEFLEEHVGVRFLTPDHTHVPELRSVHRVGPLDRAYSPPLVMRNSYYAEAIRNPKFATRRRLNTVTEKKKFGGRTGFRNINHSFQHQIPTKKYGEDHPSYFAKRNGKRLAGPYENDSFKTQPCMTNEQVLDIVTESVLEHIRNHPNARNVSVTQNDNNNYCQCSSCSRINEREGSPMGSLLAFVNSVAERVAEKHPDVYVGTLAYRYSRKPPEHLKPRDNVQIELASIEACQIHPINDPNCPKNTDFAADLKEWSTLTDQLMVWNYTTNFRNYLLPMPNLRTIGPNIRFFINYDVKGLFMQGIYNTPGGELSDLRNYLISELLWDPSQNTDRLIAEFLRLHYRRAAPYIQRYIDLVHDTAEGSGVHNDCFADRAKGYGLDQELSGRLLTLFERAEEAARSDTVRRRVRKASIAAYRFALGPVWHVQDPDAINEDLRKKMKPLARQFLKRCEQFGIERAREWTSFDKERERLSNVLGL